MAILRYTIIGVLKTAAGFIYSATDLNGFLACEHLSFLDHQAALTGCAAPQPENPHRQILAALGDDHERRYLDYLRETRVAVVAIPRPERGALPTEAAAATSDAMRAGAAIIYQAAFLHDGWVGYADFLRRVERPSRLGAHSYEVADTKLARRTEPYFLLQLCNYSEHVERIQGVSPRNMSIILGTGSEEAFRVSDFSAHYRAVKARFLEAMDGATMETRPYPIPHCDICHWSELCSAQLAAANSLSGVARIRRIQSRRLEAAGIETLTQLAAAPAEARPADMASSTWEELHDQARLQSEQRDALARGDECWQRIHVLPPMASDVARGFALLPPRDPGDIFFDMEGDPYYSDGTWFGERAGLEYLFGVFTEGRYKAFWGCDRDDTGRSHRLAEKSAFESFIDFSMQQRAAYPGFHIYHYASYEQTAIKRLVERHRTREEDVAELLREQRFTDLYAVTRQCLRVGEPSYSIKNLEHYYEFGQRTGTKRGDDSIVQFETWLAERERGNDGTAILDDIEQYNEFDCESTEHLLSWLWKLRNDHPEAVGPLLPARAKPLAEETLAWRAEIAATRQCLLDTLPADFEPSEEHVLSDEQRLRWLLAEMLSFYEREAAPQWWRFFDACREFADDQRATVEHNGAAIGGLDFVAQDDAGTLFRFPNQTHKLRANKSVMDLATLDRCGEIVSLDNDACVLTLRLPKDAPLPRAIIEGPSTFMSKSLVLSLMRVSKNICESARVQRDALTGVLLREAPRFTNIQSGASIQPEQPDGESILPLVKGLDSSALVVQGPPGSGKTQVAAELIVALIASGNSVGVTGPSHAANHNLLDRIALVAKKNALSFRGRYKYSTKKDKYVPGAGVPEGYIDSRTTVKPDGRELYCGTPWLFANPDFGGKLDYLFVDEAGQVELAKYAAMTPAARNVVMFGDPAQLEYVSHSSHPAGVGKSVLGHLLGDAVTVPEDRGVFLTVTHRMHAEVCRFISDLSYDGRLHEDPSCNKQSVHSAGLSGAGLRALAVHHVGNSAASREEAERIEDEIAMLLEGTLVDRNGSERPVRPEDVIVVSPYNAQRNLIESRLRARFNDAIEVGTVNKFQGREAYVVFYSMATSSGDEMPRSTEFLFERNRLNVAVSRARALAVLVYSPALLRTPTPSIDAMRLVNGLDRFLELAVQY